MTREIRRFNSSPIQVRTCLCLKIGRRDGLLPPPARVRAGAILSNFLAIATVTAAMQRMLVPVVETAVSGADVWIGRPDVERHAPGANICLYRSSVSSAVRRQESPVPFRGARARSHIALDLHYLLTFHGDDGRLEPQRLLGAVIAAVNAGRVLDASLLADVRAATTDEPPMHSYLGASDLGDADDPVQLAPESMTIEELAHLWSLFASFPCPLASTFLARTVTLSPNDEP